MKKPLILITALASILLALPAAAQFAKPEDAIKYRKASLSVMGTHFSRVGAMATGKAPYDAKAAAENADIAAAMAKLPWAAFTEGSDKGETRAKPEIWKDSAKFKEAGDKMQAELAKLAVAAKAGAIVVSLVSSCTGTSCGGGKKRDEAPLALHTNVIM